MTTEHFALVLAAGKGTRMRSRKPKVLQTLLGEPMLGLVLNALRPVFGSHILVVAGHGSALLRQAFPDCAFVDQAKQLGTGHALKVAMPELKRLGASRATVINGDAPLVTASDIQGFVEAAAKADIAFASIRLAAPGAYGRVIRDNGRVRAIVEARDYDPGKYGKPSGEVNAGMYCLDVASVEPLLAGLGNANASGEYYITDIVALGIEAGLNVEGIPCAAGLNLAGVNSPVELAQAENALAGRVADALLASGVCVHAPELLRASPFAVIEPGAEIFAPVEIYGHSRICAGAVVQSHCVIRDSIIHGNALIRNFSHLDNAEVGEDAQVGPYTRLRPGAKLECGSRAGNFVELKKATLGKGAKASHLTYLGDADIGPGANIGAGTITCNYDGRAKHHTSIGAQAFIGSNTALVAPVNVGDGALIGAGSAITRDVPAGEMAIARARQENRPKRKH